VLARADEQPSQQHTVTITFSDGSPTAISFAVDGDYPIPLEQSIGRLNLVAPSKERIGWIENRTQGQTLEVRVKAIEQPINIIWYGVGLKPGRFALNSGVERSFRKVKDFPQISVDQNVSQAKTPAPVPAPIEAKPHDISTMNIADWNFDLLWEKDKVRVCTGNNNLSQSFSLADNKEVLLVNGNNPVARIFLRKDDLRDFGYVVVTSLASRSIEVRFGFLGQPCDQVTIEPSKAKRFDLILRK